ncbi:MAG: RNA polymerase factor sigma-54 [Gammaproteobacteria bacterium]|nr:RNA polymerase factor sigma-54 [Gammaproteobacteria bacterium]
MKQSLQLRLGQHLTMTPQLQQAIRLLQLSTFELQAEVQQALESNLMLEEADEDHEAAPDTELNGDAQPRNGDAQSAGGERELNVADIPNELPVDSAWEDIYDSAPTHYGTGDSNGLEPENQRGTTETLLDYLYWQLGLGHFTDTDKVVAAAIIDSISEEGYLTTSLEDIQQSVARDAIEVDLEEVAAMLHQVQNFDPPGVGARDLQECLSVQLQQLPPDTEARGIALELVAKHLDLLAARDYTQLIRRLNIDQSRLHETIALIRSLNPRPGYQIHSAPPHYVIPDVYVFKNNGTWHVELNAEALPRLRINPHYASLIRRADNSADNNYLKTHMQEARWFLKSLKSRSETLLKVASCIVQRQQAFLERGEEAMKPMVLHDVAEAVNMHESTVSRVTTKKYMHTPRGIYELKYFFSSHLSTAAGGECSSTAIRALIKKLIATENPRKPLSDNKLASLLADQGINVARRTVAKYREAMLIPSSNERKRLV